MSSTASGKVSKQPNRQSPTPDTENGEPQGEQIERLSPGQALSPGTRRKLNPAQIRALQQGPGNRTVQRLLAASQDGHDAANEVAAAGEQPPTVQRDDDEGRYVRYEMVGRSRAPVDRFRAALEAAIPPDQQTGLALRMMQVLPAVAAILDEYLSAQHTRAEILDRSSSSHPASYGGLELEPDDANALWDFYKARWESRDAGTRRSWLRLGQRRIGQLLLPWATQRHIPQRHRQLIRGYIDRLIRQRISALRTDRNYAVLSEGGVPVEEPIILTPPAPGAAGPRAGRPRGPRERLLTPEETGELYEVDDPNAPVTADEIEQARREIQVQVVRSRMDEFVNTDVLAPMPVAAGNRPNIRTEAFGQLIALLQQQAELEADIDQRSRPTAGAAAPPEGGTPPAESPELASLRQRLETLRGQIRAQATRAAEIALRWYRQREADIGEGVEPTRPEARGRQRLPRASTASGPRGVRMYYVRRAIEALEGGRLLRRYRRVHYRGTVAGRQINIAPARLGPKVDRPEGHVAGGPGYQEGLLEQRVQQSGLPAEHHPLALHVLRAFRRLEGAPQSLNTWDSAVLTLGSGIAARGRLQRALGEFKQANPQGFRALFGRFGLDVYGSGQNWGISVRVPQQPIGEGYRPGELLEGERAMEYIANDPALLVQLRRAGHAGAWQSFLIDDAIESVREALAYQYRSVAWGRLMQGLPSALVEGTYFALANSIHGAGNTRSVTRALDQAWPGIRRESGLEPEQLATDERGQEYRRRLAVAAARSAAANRRRAFIEQVPELAQHL